jgi:hypothetical protein
VYRWLEEDERFAANRAAILRQRRDDVYDEAEAMVPRALENLHREIHAGNVRASMALLRQVNAFRRPSREKP